jgi:release factor glutamine methyltransferase
MSVDRAALVMDPGRPVEGPVVRAFQDLVRRRSAGREPVAYLLGRKGFRHLELEVDDRVLIPRPETETLVEAALDLPQGAVVLDVGTGSGAVALALKDERPDLVVTGSDVSEDALDVARANAARLGLDVEFVQADLLDGAPAADAIVANPPYVADGERASLAPEIVRHEPGVALFSGPDGLGVVSRLVAQAGTSSARFLALELGEGQAEAVRELMGAAGFADVSARRDLAGIERVVVGRRC